MGGDAHEGGSGAVKSTQVRTGYLSCIPKAADADSEAWCQISAVLSSQVEIDPSCRETFIRVNHSKDKKEREKKHSSGAFVLFILLLREQRKTSLFHILLFLL